MMDAEFMREAIDRLDGLFHQPLRAGNFFFEALSVDRGLLFQRQQANIDAQQRLGDFIMQIATDLLSFVLLCLQNLAGQALQMFLQAT